MVAPHADHLEDVRLLLECADRDLAMKAGWTAPIPKGPRDTYMEYAGFRS